MVDVVVDVEEDANMVVVNDCVEGHEFERERNLTWRVVEARNDKRRHKERRPLLERRFALERIEEECSDDETTRKGQVLVYETPRKKKNFKNKNEHQYQEVGGRYDEDD